MLIIIIISNKCNKIIDWYHNELIDTIGLQNYWCHPPIVEQGSHNGKMQSIIDDKKYGPWPKTLVKSS